MAEQIRIKAYLKQQPKDEIRLFFIDWDVATSFVYLTEMLQTQFPQIRGKRINVCWRDEFDDMITVSSDTELQIALLEMKTYSHKYYKIYVRLDETVPDTSDTPSHATMIKDKHPNIVCDSCDSSIYGFRYKCIECIDYDLCAKCEALECHPNHCMLRLPYPIDTLPYLQHAVKRFSKSLSRLKTKIYVAELHESKKRCSPTRSGCYHKTCPIILEKQTKNGGVSGRKNEGTAQEQKERECKVDSNEATQPKSTDQSTPGEHRENNSKRGNNCNGKPHECFFDQILDIDKIISTFGIGAVKILSGLEPFLSDLNNYGSDNSKSQNPQEPKENQKQPQENTPQPSTSSIDKETQNSANKEPSPLDNIGTDVGTTTNQSTENEKQQKKVENSEDSQNKATNEKKEEDDKDSKDAEAKSSINEEDTKSEKTEWIIIDKNVEETTSKSPQVEPESPATPMPKIYPTLPEGEKIYHSNPKIQNAIETMIAMGFSNKGGLLTYLLDAENGNIAKVLDLLEPAHD